MQFVFPWLIKFCKYIWNFSQTHWKLPNNQTTFLRYGHGYPETFHHLLHPRPFLDANGALTAAVSASLNSGEVDGGSVVWSVFLSGKIGPGVVVHRFLVSWFGMDFAWVRKVPCRNAPCIMRTWQQRHDVLEETLSLSCFQPITSISLFQTWLHISFPRCSMWQAAPRGGQGLNLEKDIGNFNVPWPQQMMSEVKVVCIAGHVYVILECFLLHKHTIFNSTLPILQ